MADQYAAACGFVQFEVNDENLKTVNINGQDKVVFEVTIKAIGFQGQPLVKVSLWDNFAAVHGKIKRGDWLEVDGKYRGSSGRDGRTYHQITPKFLRVNGETIGSVETDRPQVANPVAAESGALPF